MMTPPMKRAPPATVMQSNVVAVAEVDDDGVFLESWRGGKRVDDPVAPTVSGSSTSSTMEFGTSHRPGSGWRVVPPLMPSAQALRDGGRNDATIARESCVECPAFVRLYG